MSAEPVRRVLVAGGGIGGLAAAVALQHKGFQVSVFESADALRDGGAGLHIWTNGTIALDRLGVADAVLETAPAQRICHFGTWRGEIFGAWPVGDFVAEYGRPTLAVERSVLHAILRRALAGDPVRTGAGVVGFTQDTDGVTVRLADGRYERGDVLIGADGIHSVVRAGLLGAAPPRFNGYIAWRGKGYLEHELIPPGSFYALFGRGTRFTFYDVAPGVVHWMSVANGPPGGHDGPGVAALLADRHRGWMPPVQDILAATPETEIIRSDVLDRKPDRRWGTGRVTLLGDAAHPITFNIGQGACQALEDALVLADRLGARPDDPARALRRYERDRRGRTASMQRVAWLIGRMGAVEHPLLIAAREMFMRLVWPTLAFRIAERDQIAYAKRWRTPAPPLSSTEVQNR
ncbi:FAD-dependent oxidoreductase [Nocardia transvalensis]|uniref:FAD-dependent oxidoreductase n=1 Tax=Nocardia transvalensis TaxID=37333 RepID=UPI001894AFC8|nr:FAD-dependent monooxygenase [Nocardia transvalensis]MBF6329915.1 FAD-dependent monooxygenase [Nocardia transvalensis]